MIDTPLWAAVFPYFTPIAERTGLVEISNQIINAILWIWDF
jgi:hypothetical protein